MSIDLGPTSPESESLPTQRSILLQWLRLGCILLLPLLLFVGNTALFTVCVERSLEAVYAYPYVCKDRAQKMFKSKLEQLKYTEAYWVIPNPPVSVPSAWHDAVRQAQPAHWGELLRIVAGQLAILGLAFAAQLLLLRWLGDWLWRGLDEVMLDGYTVLAGWLLYATCMAATQFEGLYSAPGEWSWDFHYTLCLTMSSACILFAWIGARRRRDSLHYTFLIATGVGLLPVVIYFVLGANPMDIMSFLWLIDLYIFENCWGFLLALGHVTHVRSLIFAGLFSLPLCLMILGTPCLRHFGRPRAILALFALAFAGGHLLQAVLVYVDASARPVKTIASGFVWEVRSLSGMQLLAVSVLGMVVASIGIAVLIKIIDGGGDSFRRDTGSYPPPRFSRRRRAQ